MAENTVRQGQGNHTSRDELFAKVWGFTYVVRNGRVDYPTIRAMTSVEVHTVDEVVIHERPSGELVEELIVLDRHAPEELARCGRSRMWVK